MTEPGISTCGLSARELELVRGVLGRHAQVSRAMLFGSRAMARARPESDVDLALWGDLDAVLEARIRGEPDELPLPYLFDVQSYDSIRHPDLTVHIDRVGCVIYVRTG